MSPSPYSLRRSALIAAAAFLVAPVVGHAQSAKPNWQNLDLQADSVFGISTERAYTELLKNKPAQKRIIVAVIDGGVDIAHEDLKAVIWVNSKETPGNKKDDDKNGYVDDVSGWNFIGSASGDIEYEALELTRLIRRLRPKYGAVTDPSTLSQSERDTLDLYNEMLADYDRQLRSATMTLANVEGAARAIDTLVARVGKPNPTAEDLDKFQPTNAVEERVKRMVLDALKAEPDFATFREKAIDGPLKHFRAVVNNHLNFDYNPRAIVHDDTLDDRQRVYGSANVVGPDAEHGTHVSGIVAAVRNNTAGIKGVADAVTILPIRAIPSGDERDKDVANAIRYAVDQGAKVINMSFGKAYSSNKAVVDDAVKYAMSKDVLLVHGAGNDGNNLDKTPGFPNRTYADGSGQAKAWITVGASNVKDDAGLVAMFSNYGKTTVDVFAPGVKIYSTVPGSKYQEQDGTSMAAPVVSGLAALIWSRYPKLTAVQVKDIIMQSVAKSTQTVWVRDEGRNISVPFAETSVSGGVVNAYNALKLAETYK